MNDEYEIKMAKRLAHIVCVLIIIAIGFYNSKAFGNEISNSCEAHVPYGMPTIHKEGSVVLCRDGYVLQHDNKAKIPLWASYVLTPERTIGCVVRTNKFQSDPDLPKGSRAEVSDYRKSGYDMGHNVNDADQSWSVSTEAQSFYLSNMSPQLPGFNRGIFKRLEGTIRDWSWVNQDTLVVYVGNIYTKESSYIGSNFVTVPNAMYKIIINQRTKESIAFLLPHTEGLDKLSDYVVSVAEIEKQTGIVFNIPDDKNKVSAMWKIPSSKDRANAKAQACSLKRE